LRQAYDYWQNQPGNYPEAQTVLIKHKENYLAITPPFMGGRNRYGEGGFKEAPAKNNARSTLRHYLDYPIAPTDLLKRRSATTSI